MIIRVEHRKRFTVIADPALRDSQISFRATGVLAYLLSLPDGTKISGREMTAAKREGRDAILAALGELEKAGYLIRTRTQAASGTWFTTCVLNEQPPENPSPSPGNQDSVFQDSVFQDSKSLNTKNEYQLQPSSLETGSENPNPHALPDVPVAKGLVDRIRHERGWERPDHEEAS